jgi:hypothetical protein
LRGALELAEGVVSAGVWSVAGFSPGKRSKREMKVKSSNDIRRISD